MEKTEEIFDERLQGRIFGIFSDLIQNILKK